MKILTSNTNHTTNIYEKGQYGLIWNLSVVVFTISALTSMLFFSFDTVVFFLYLLMFLTSVFSLYYLKKYKKVKPIFCLYTIIASAILIGSFHTQHNTLHYQDILWTISIILFAFIGLDYKYSIFVASIHGLSLVLFTFFSLNTNISTVSILPNYQLLVFSIESIFAFTIVIVLIHHFLKYQKFTRVELGNTRIKYQNIIENMNEALIQDNREGKIVFWNKKFLTMFDYVESDMDDMHITEIINQEEDLDSIHLRHKQRISGMRNDDRLIYRGKRKNGDIIWMEINVTPLYENGEIIGTQSLIWDITHKKEQEIQILRVNEELTKIEEAERERIAYEIHDGLNQILVAARLHVELASSKEKLLEMIDCALYESRTITKKLAPKDINEFGLISAVKLLSMQIGDSNDLKINFICNRESDFFELTNSIQFNIYRIVQECMNNTIKHAKASEVQIEINSFKNNLIIQFSNNGLKIPKVKLDNKNFLISIKRRVNILNGELKIINNRKGKVTFLISIPSDFKAIELKKAI